MKSIVILFLAIFALISVVDLKITIRHQQRTVLKRTDILRKVEKGASYDPKLRRKFVQAAATDGKSLSDIKPTYKTVTSHSYFVKNDEVPKDREGRITDLSGEIDKLKAQNENEKTLLTTYMHIGMGLLANPTDFTNNFSDAIVKASRLNNCDENGYKGEIILLQLFENNQHQVTYHDKVEILDNYDYFLYSKDDIALIVVEVHVDKVEGWLASTERTNYTPVVEGKTSKKVAELQGGRILPGDNGVVRTFKIVGLVIVGAAGIVLAIYAGTLATVFVAAPASVFSIATIFKLVCLTLASGAMILGSLAGGLIMSNNSNRNRLRI